MRTKGELESFKKACCHDAISGFADITLTAGLEGKDVVISFEAEPAADFRPLISVTEEGYTRLEVRTHEFPATD